MLGKKKTGIAMHKILGMLLTDGYFLVPHTSTLCQFKATRTKLCWRQQTGSVCKKGTNHPFIPTLLHCRLLSPWIKHCQRGGSLLYSSLKDRRCIITSTFPWSRRKTMPGIVMRVLREETYIQGSPWGTRNKEVEIKQDSNHSDKEISLVL